MIPYVPGQVTADDARRLIIKFRNTFLATEDSRLVWAMLHAKLGTWSSNRSPSAEEAALKSFGMELLEMAGINHEVNEFDLVNKLWEIPPSFETEEREKKSRSS